MSENSDSAEKTHDPTPKKLLDARTKGELAKSNDLLAAAAYLGLILALVLTGSSGLLSAASSLMEVFEDPFVSISEAGELDGSHVSRLVIMGVFIPSLPIFLIPASVVILCLIAQRAFVFAPSKLTPKLSKISPISSVKNKFGRTGLFEFGKSSFKLIIVCILMIWFLLDHVDILFATTEMEPLQVTGALAGMILDFLIYVLVMSLSVGGIDYLWQLSDNFRKNMMTRKEVEDESKEAEGDPHHKQKRRQRGYEIAMNQMLADVPTADVVIVNPTHYAVALKWDANSGLPPVCLAKGIDEIAARIREVATDAGVPIHSDPPTARSIHARINVGDIIWPEDYKAVAAAIRFAQDMVSKGRR